MSQPVGLESDSRWHLSWTLNDLTEVLVRAARESSTAQVTVEDAMVEWRLDLAEEPVLLVTMALSDPPPGADTWPVEDLYQIRTGVRERAAGAGVPVGLAFSLRSAHPVDEPVESDEDAAAHVDPPQQSA